MNGGSLNSIYDTILWVESEGTGKRFPVVLFSADTDMATAGWVTLTSTERTEVIVTELTGEEYRATAKGPSGYLAVEQRINAALGRVDLRCPWFVRTEQTGPSPKGLSFQEFRKVYRPPITYYRDIFEAGRWRERYHVSHAVSLSRQAEDWLWCNDAKSS